MFERFWIARPLILLLVGTIIGCSQSDEAAPKIDAPVTTVIKAAPSSAPPLSPPVPKAIPSVHRPSPEMQAFCREAKLMAHLVLSHQFETFEAGRDNLARQAAAAGLGLVPQNDAERAYQHLRGAQAFVKMHIEIKAKIDAEIKVTGRVTREFLNLWKDTVAEADDSARKALASVDAAEHATSQ